MKKEETITGMATELLNMVAEEKNKNNAMIILSVFDTEDDEKSGSITAACGTVTRMATILSFAMMKDEHLKEAVMMAADLNGIIGGESPSSSFPRGLAALLGAMGK